LAGIRFAFAVGSQFQYGLEGLLRFGELTVLCVRGRFGPQGLFLAHHCCDSRVAHCSLDLAKFFIDIRVQGPIDAFRLLKLAFGGAEVTFRDCFVRRSHQFALLSLRTWPLRFDLTGFLPGLRAVDEISRRRRHYN